MKTVFQLSQKIYEEDFDGIKELYLDRPVKRELAEMIGMITNFNDLMSEAMEGKEVINNYRTFCFVSGP